MKCSSQSFIASVQLVYGDSSVMLDELGNGIWAAWDVGVNIHLAGIYSCYVRKEVMYVWC